MCLFVTKVSFYANYATDLLLMIIAILSTLLVMGFLGAVVIAGIVFARNKQWICSS